MVRLLTKKITFDYYSGYILSGIVWLACVLFFLSYLYKNPEESTMFAKILLPAILLGTVSYIVFVYSLVNILDARLNQTKSKIIKFLRPLILAIFIVVLLIGGSSLVLAGAFKINTIVDGNKQPVLTNISSAQPVSAFVLWDKVNDWQKEQGYQPYVQSTYLCDIADKFLDFAVYWSDEYLRKNLKTYFSNSSYAWNFSLNRSPEDAVLNYWISNPNTKKNLTDFYYYSCLKCKNNNCLQLFYNELSKTTANTENKSTIDTDEWGKVKQISEHTYTQKVGSDAIMGSPADLLIALNNFRNKYDRSSLIWDDSLSSWAQSRAQTFANLKNVDEHAGFNAEVENKFNEFGGRFTKLGENAGFGGRLDAVHWIEWLFASDEPHKNNMLGDWSHVGIATASNDGFNYGIDFIFGKSR